LKDRLAGQPIKISYKITKKRPFTPSGLTKKRTLEQEFYEKNNLASKLFLFNKETLVEIFFESVFWKIKCNCWCSHFLHNCCFLESSVSLILITMSLPEKQPSYKEPLSPVERMQSGLAASFVAPSLKKNDGDGNQFVNDKSFIDQRKLSSTTVAKGVLNNGEHTLIPVMA
jgi:hypothetical protein